MITNHIDVIFVTAGDLDLIQIPVLRDPEKRASVKASELGTVYTYAVCNRFIQRLKTLSRLVLPPLSLSLSLSLSRFLSSPSLSPCLSLKSMIKVNTISACACLIFSRLLFFSSAVKQIQLSSFPYLQNLACSSGLRGCRSLSGLFPVREPRPPVHHVQSAALGAGRCSFSILFLCLFSLPCSSHNSSLRQIQMFGWVSKGSVFRVLDCFCEIVPWAHIDRLTVNYASVYSLSIYWLSD